MFSQFGLPQRSKQHVKAFAFTGGALALAGLLSGCAGNMPANFGVSAPVSAVHVSGTVFGGQQPVAGSTIQLYTVGTTGVRSASRAMLTATVLSDVNGNFSITGLYSCAAAGSTPAATQVYVTATGGNPGSGVNSAVTMAAALGSCATLQANASSTFILVNELTTVAAAYGLAPFAADVADIGATGTNPAGLVTAFANAGMLVNTSNGQAPGANLATGVTVPVAEMNTIANILAACINTSGPSSAACTRLSGATGVGDTFGAALQIAKNPGAAAITALYDLSTGTAPFQPAMATRPNDFAVAVNYAGSGVLATPYGLAIDATGNAWVTNESGNTVTEISPTGAQLANATSATLYGAQGVALDRTGNVWVANTAGNSVIKFGVTGGAITSNTSYTAGGVTGPAAIALDSAGDAFVANFNGNSVTGLSNSGTPLAGSPFTAGGSITVPSGIAVGSTGAVYVTSGRGSVVVLSNSGGVTATATDNAIQGPLAIALDPVTGNGEITGFTTGTAIAGALSEINASGVPAASSPVTSGLTTPAGVASDGASIWVANSTPGGSLAQFVFGNTAASSPAAGFGSLSTPVGVAVDGSGSVWTANSGNNTVSKFIGLATPVVTPLAAVAGP